MSLPQDVNLRDALLLLKREMIKAARTVPFIEVPEQAFDRIVRAIDPEGLIYPDPPAMSIEFAGMIIASRKSVA